MLINITDFDRSSMAPVELFHCLFTVATNNFLGSVGDWGEGGGGGRGDKA
jgi:hypothetical protein